MPLSPKERLALGQQRRKQMRRAEHGVWKAKERREDPLKLMEKSMHGRVPALAALKYERMEASPFGYFRGAVPVMAYDFSLASNTGILTQLCGDAHVRNLGAYAGSDGRLCSILTISMRRLPVRLNGMSSAWPPAWCWLAVKLAQVTKIAVRPREFSWSDIVAPWRHLRACQYWTWQGSRSIACEVFRQWSGFSKWRSARLRQIP